MNAADALQLIQRRPRKPTDRILQLALGEHLPGSRGLENTFRQLPIVQKISSAEAAWQGDAPQGWDIKQ